MQINHFQRNVKEIHDELKDVRAGLGELAGEVRDVQARVTRLEVKVATPYDAFTLGASKPKHN